MGLPKGSGRSCQDLEDLGASRAASVATTWARSTALAALEAQRAQLAKLVSSVLLPVVPDHF